MRSSRGKSLYFYFILISLSLDDDSSRIGTAKEEERIEQWTDLTTEGMIECRASEGPVTRIACTRRSCYSSFSLSLSLTSHHARARSAPFFPFLPLFSNRSDNRYIRRIISDYAPLCSRVLNTSVLFFAMDGTLADSLIEEEEGRVSYIELRVRALLFRPILAFNPIFVSRLWERLPSPSFSFFLRFSASRSSVAESVASHNRAAGVASPPPRRGAQFLAPVDRATGGRPFGWQQTLPPPVTVADKMHPKRLSYFPPSPRSLALAKSLTPRLSGRIEPRHWISRIPELFQTPFFLAKSERERRRPLLFLSLSE